MKASLVIYGKALGIYAIVSLPAIFFPTMYILSLFYAVVYGCFAFIVFILVYLLVDYFRVPFNTRMAVLSLGIIAGVCFAYQMMETFGVEDDVWESPFILFPAAAIIAGLISLSMSAKLVKADCIGQTVTEPEEEEPSIF